MRGTFKWNTITKLCKFYTQYIKPNWAGGSVQFKSPTALEYAYATYYMDFDTNCYIIGPGGVGGVLSEAGTMTGVTAAVGSAVGEWIFDADADTVVFPVRVPDWYVDDGVATSLIPQLYADATTQTNGIDAIFYHPTSTTALLTDAYEVTTDVGWFDLETATGMGDLALEPGEVILISLSPDAAQTTNVLRFRWKYKCGINLKA